MNRIKELRKKNSYTQTELAALCKTTTSNVSGWECGKWQPDNDMLILLADTFNVTIDYLLGRDNELTNKEKNLGIGRHATYLSEDEWEWLELRSEILRIYGERYLNTLNAMLTALIETKPTKS